MSQNNKSKEPIHISNLDVKFRLEVTSHQEASALNACFSCGTCTAGCPISEFFPEYSPKKLAKMVKLGMRQSVLRNPFIWYCTTCRSCDQHCPQNVKFFNILNVLKNMAVKEGYAPSPWVEQTRQIMKTGLVVPQDEHLAEKRADFSLPALKNDGIQAKKLLELTGIDKIIKAGNER